MTRPLFPPVNPQAPAPPKTTVVREHVRRIPTEEAPHVPRKPKKAKPNWRREADRWILTNQRGYFALARTAQDWRREGRKFGAKALAEWYRWQSYNPTQADGTDQGYKLNNNLVSYIARRLVKDYPELEGYLRFRDTRY